MIKEAKRREKIFKNLSFHLKNLKRFLKKIDRRCRIFLFGSVAKNEHVLSSDIDILILTSLKPNEVIAELRKTGFDEPFEFHVVDEKRFKIYKKFIKEMREI